MEADAPPPDPDRDTLPSPGKEAPPATEEAAPPATGEDPPPVKQDATAPTVELHALPYHHDVVRYLREQAPSVWRHFASPEFDRQTAESLRLHLLKTTVVLDRESEVELYRMANEVAAALDLGVPVELYQGEDAGTLNAALYFLPTVARVVFFGPLQDRLTPEEMRALLAHELAHHRLYVMDDGVHYTANQALRAMEGMEGLEAIENTCRLHALTTEVFADRAAIALTDRETTMRCLMKVRTGRTKVDPEAFLAQSRELLAAEGTGSREWTHPEAHLRVLAVEAFAQGGRDADADVQHLLEGPIQLPALDLLRRAELEQRTRTVVNELLQPAWFRSETVIGHARLLFDDYAHEDEPPLPAEALAPYGDTVLDYLAFVLVDFVAVDPDLEDLPLLRAHVVAERLGIEARLERAVNKELKRTKKSIQEALGTRDARLEAAEGTGA